ncbi:MAG: LPS export ABC transporter periplasmic protein LptC [Alphaproteobacteria bacterium]|nr:LPS export ABC transporter periplasmic protein LptC [Alphaproteobacteria bacterium]
MTVQRAEPKIRSGRPFGWRAAWSARRSVWDGLSPRRSALPGDRYSRRVALLKHLLPAIGLVLLLLVAVWPRLGPLLERVRLAFPAIDLREARELRMVNPRYAGTDREGRPYVVTAAVGRQDPSRQDLMSLEAPRAEIRMHSGALVVVTGMTGIYQSQAQLLDLFDNVNLVHDNGTRFVTRAARLHVADSSTEGDEPVEGHGPSGDVSSQGFRILNKGDTIVFTGTSDLVLKGAKPAPTPAPPSAVPADIGATAARIEAAAAPAPRGGKPAAQPIKPAAAPQRVAQATAHGKPAAHPASKRAH